MRATICPVSTALALVITVVTVGAAAAERPPNLIFFFVDDLGWQETSVCFHDDPTPRRTGLRTPAWERLAGRGMKFTQAYASAVCSPARVSYFTV